MFENKNKNLNYIDYMSSNSVFMKKVPEDFKIEYEAILETIPPGSHKEPQPDKEHMVETRWRFLHIPQKETVKRVVEISRKKYGEHREYWNKRLKWEVSTVDPVFDQYVVEQYYYYTEN